MLVYSDLPIWDVNLYGSIKEKFNLIQFLNLIVNSYRMPMNEKCYMEKNFYHVQEIQTDRQTTL